MPKLLLVAQIFSTAGFDLGLSEVRFRTDAEHCAKFDENRTRTFGEITVIVSVTNEPTNQPTRVITIPPGGHDI